MDTKPELAVSELYKIARRATRRYARLPWVDLEDAAQAAVVDLLGALRGLRELPDNLGSYLHRVAWLSVQHHVWTMTSPVRHSDRGQLPREASQVVREAGDGEALACRPDSAAAADDQLAVAAWTRAVRRRVRELVADDCRQERQVVERLLRDDAPSREVADDSGVPVQLVYAVSARMKSRILRDAQMQALWREMPSRVDEE